MTWSPTSTRARLASLFVGSSVEQDASALHAPRAASGGVAQPAPGQRSAVNFVARTNSAPQGDPSPRCAVVWVDGVPVTFDFVTPGPGADGSSPVSSPTLASPRGNSPSSGEATLVDPSSRASSTAASAALGTQTSDPNDVAPSGPRPGPRPQLPAQRVKAAALRRPWRRPSDPGDAASGAHAREHSAPDARRAAPALPQPLRLPTPVDGASAAGLAAADRLPPLPVFPRPSALGTARRPRPPAPSDRQRADALAQAEQWLRSAAFVHARRAQLGRREAPQPPAQAGGPGNGASGPASAGEGAPDPSAAASTRRGRRHLYRALAALDAGLHAVRRAGANDATLLLAQLAGAWAGLEAQFFLAWPAPPATDAERHALEDDALRTVDAWRNLLATVVRCRLGGHLRFERAAREPALLVDGELFALPPAGLEAALRHAARDAPAVAASLQMFDDELAELGAASA